LENRSATDVQKSKVLHDYAFNVALDTLHEKGFLLAAEDLDPINSSLPEAAFVLVKGAAKIFDYSTFENLAKHEKSLDKILSSQPTGNREQRRRTPGKKGSGGGVFGDLKVLVDAFFKDSIQVRIDNLQGVGFIGPISRGYLREDIQNLIFKYGSKPQGEWAMLAQVTRTPSYYDAASLQLESSLAESGGEDAGEVQTASNALNEVLDIMNSFQEFMGSAAYPDVSVSPIAVFRETLPLSES